MRENQYWTVLQESLRCAQEERSGTRGSGFGDHWIEQYGQVESVGESRRGCGQDESGGWRVVWDRQERGIQRVRAPYRALLNVLLGWTQRTAGESSGQVLTDDAYGSGHNGWEAERRGTELVSPVGGRAPAEADRGDRPVKLTAADFDIDVTARRAAVCPAGHEAVSEYEDEDAPERVEMHFAREMCEPCTLRSRCPVRWRRRPELGGEWSPSGAYVLSADLARVNIGRRRRAESDGQWRKRYGLGAGIEGTNSELKRRHGLGRLRVRGGERVRLAVYLKALACNVKRMVRARLTEMLARPAVLATAPTAA